MNEPELGAVATSRAGHDRGRAFVIVGRADSEHVLLADGDTRRMEKPKKKKLRHLHIEPRTAESIREALLAGRTVLDADLRKALAALDYNTESGK